MPAVVSGRPCLTSHPSSFADGAVYQGSLEAPPRRGAARTSRRHGANLARAGGADRAGRRSPDRGRTGSSRGRVERSKAPGRPGRGPRPPLRPPPPGGFPRTRRRPPPPEGAFLGAARCYRNDVDLVLVDDVHFLEGKEMTQEEFFHTFNALFEGHKQIVLTSDRPPKEIPGLEDRLISRFEWGLVADIGHPDLEHRIAILRKKAEQDHLELTIPDDVLRFIAEHIRSSVRELEGCIIKLLLFASLKNREVTIELAREALSDKIRQGEDASSYGAQPTPSIDRVQEVVARRWGVTPEGLRSKARTKTLTIPRQVAMYLARDMLGMQLVEIGQACGGRDHSTVIHSVDKVERQMVRDRTLNERVEMAREDESALEPTRGKP